MIVLTSLTIGGLLLSVFQGGDLETMVGEDINMDRGTLETISSLDSMIDMEEDRSPFNGTKVGKVFRVPIRGPVLYTERMVDPTLYSLSHYKSSILGGSK